jgi:alkylation response protein AidB-like acyl-CoA dehydrogenase
MSDLVSRAESLRSTLEQHAEETDRLRRLPDGIVTALKETGLCRLMIPKRLGGFETDIHTYIAVMAELGRGCGSTAWVASLINVCAWLTGLFPERAQQDVFGADRDAWVAGSLAPHGTATPVDGGWRVSGRWMWASGSLHAQWAACGIHMNDEKGETANLGLSLMPMSDLAIEDTWFMAGMKGTGEAVYRVALVPVTVLILIGSQLGIARAALELAVAKGHTRGITHTNYGRQVDSAGFQIQIAEAAMKIETASLHAFRAADDLDRASQGGRHPELVERARVRTDTALVAKYCREAVELLVSAHGTSSLADWNRMQRLWRDVHVASHHAITEWQVNLEIYGKALLGVEPNITPLI